MLAFIFLPSPVLHAHPQLQFTTLQLSVEPSGQFHGTLYLDIIGYAQNKKPKEVTNNEVTQLQSTPDNLKVQSLARARERIERSIQVRTDNGNGSITSWDSLPSLEKLNDALDQVTDMEPFIFMPVALEFSGTLPANMKTLSVFLPDYLGDSILIYNLQGKEVHSEPVPGGHWSSEFQIDLASQSFSNRAKDFFRYIWIGWQHIIPEGLDHILFVLGLFLLSPRLAPLLWQVSAFTIAHSVTLGLSIYGVFRLPPSIVEPIIAASIAFIAIENIFTSELKAWRPFVVFFFGLIHGLGFASAFAEVGLPQQDFLMGLIGFNLGVECGQFSVIAIAFLLVGWFRQKTWYRKGIVIPASILISAVAIFWTIQRIYS